MRDLAHLLELYIRNPDALTADDRAMIAGRVATDETWREAWLFWTEYYEALREPGPSAQIIHLNPYQEAKDPVAGSVTLLAAKGPDPATRHTAIAILESDDGNTLVRFLWDKQDLRLHAFVIGEAVAEEPLLYLPHYDRGYLIASSGRSEVLQEGGSPPPAASLSSALLVRPCATEALAASVAMTSGPVTVELQREGSSAEGMATFSESAVAFLAASTGPLSSLTRLRSGRVNL
ncbi:MAG: hypothetical protein HKN29_14275, partial [Rhodothermales bacterium]|nr:hypothetical protein [Rhodothermales bacterium]